MAMACQLSAVAAITMVALVLAAAIATLTSVITAQEPPTPGKNCFRKCIEGDTRTCHFNFDVHLYQTMSRACYNCPRNATDCSRPECIAGDGVKRKIIVVNKQMPGPHIQVCEGDKIVVDVKNSMPGEGLTVHWHGLTQTGPMWSTPSSFSGTPYMDGVPGITQCPIQAGASFRYSFYASDAGTHFYHAHSGFHRGEGVFGAITVRQPPARDVNIDKYDYDLPQHTIVFHDWLHIPAVDKFVLRHHGGGDDFADSMLVNGRGPHQHPNATQVSASIPYQRFKVMPGNRYRMRLINVGILNCPITFSIDQHMLTIIEADGNPIRPINATSLVTYSGERFDVVIHPKREQSGTFWMSFMGGVDCAVTSAHQFALLEYEHPPHKSFGGWNKNVDDHALLRNMPPKPMFTEVPPPGIQVNSINSACYDDLVCIADLRSPDKLAPDMRAPKADLTYYLAFEMRRINNAHFYSRIHYDFNLMGEDQQIPSPQVNNLTFMPQAAPLLLNRGEHDHKMCNAETPFSSRNCNEDFCECLHMYKIPLGSVVDMVLIDEGQHGDENHPIHLHGEYFYVLGQHRPNDVVGASITRNEVMEMDANGLLARNFDHPVYKDTVTIPDGGYTIIRFKANNPGYWLIHCHLLFHSEAGMDLVMKIGEDHEIPKAPYDFPSCDNYRHSVL